MMKSKILLLAALPAAVLAANVQADPTVYGKLNVSLQKNKVDTDPTGNTYDNWTLDSNASRVGVMGSGNLDGGLKGIYKLEYGTDVTNGDTNWSSRNSYLGVQGNWGTVIGGKFDTPTKESQGKVDQFNDYKLGDITNVIVGETRASDIMMYTSPKIANNITVNVAVIPGQNDGVTAGQHNNGPSDGSSASVVYDTDSLYLALAVDNHVVSDWNTPVMGVTYTAANQETDVVRLTGQVKLDALSLGAIVQHAKDVETASNEKQDGVILSAAYTMNKETLKAEFGHSKYSVSDAKTNSLSLGLDHSMSKDAKAYAYVTEVKTTDVTPGNDLKQTTLGVGFEQKF